MSEGQDNRSTAAGESQQHHNTAEVHAHHVNHDWFLKDIVRLSNFGLGIGITVIAEGAVISGTLIGGKQFFEELSSEMVKADYQGGNGDAVLKAISEQWASNALLYVKPDDAPEDWSMPEPGFIHIKNARVYAPGQAGMPSNRGVLWRGKLNAISGFSIGSFDPAS